MELSCPVRSASGTYCMAMRLNKDCPFDWAGPTALLDTGSDRGRLGNQKKSLINLIYAAASLFILFVTLAILRDSFTWLCVCDRDERHYDSLTQNDGYFYTTLVGAALIPRSELFLLLLF